MLIIIKIKKCPDHVRGYIRKYLTEIETGLFIGKVSKKVAEHIWKRLTTETESKILEICMILPNREKEQGFILKTHQTKRQPIDYEGVTLMAKHHKKNAPT